MNFGISDVTMASGASRAGAGQSIACVAGASTELSAAHKRHLTE
jgi:hypothetical protein